MREFMVIVKIREHSGLSVLDAQDRIRRQVSGLLTGNLEVADIEIRPMEMDGCLDVMSGLLTKMEQASQSAKGYADLAKASANRATQEASKANSTRQDVELLVEDLRGLCPFRKLKGD